MRSRGTALSQAPAARFEFREKFCGIVKMKQSEKKAIWTREAGKRVATLGRDPIIIPHLPPFVKSFFAEKNHQISLVIFVQLYECFVKIDEF